MITNKPQYYYAQRRQQAQDQYSAHRTTVTGTQTEPEAFAFFIPEVLLDLHRWLYNFMISGGLKSSVLLKISHGSFAALLASRICDLRRIRHRGFFYLRRCDGFL